MLNNCTKSSSWKSFSHARCVCRWQLTRQTRRMLNPQGPKTGRGNAAGHESGTVNPHHANAIVLVSEIALNLQKGKKKKKKERKKNHL